MHLNLQSQKSHSYHTRYGNWMKSNELTWNFRAILLLFFMFHFQTGYSSYYWQVTSISSFTGGGTYAQNSAASPLVLNLNQCAGGISQPHNSTIYNITWYQNTVNATTGGTIVSSNTVGTPFSFTAQQSYTPSTSVAGTFYYYAVLSSPSMTTCGFTGTLTSTTQTVVVSSPGAALNFSNSHINLGTTITNQLAGTHNITVEAWVYPTSNSGLGNIVGNYNTSTWDGQYRFLLRRDNTNYGFYISNGTTGGTASSSANSVTLNTWQHLVGTWDGTTVRLFINGILVATSSCGGNFPTFSHEVWIGGNSMGSENFAGNIDEVRIWSRPVCGSEIQNNMNCELSATGQTGLLGLYHFNEGYAGANNSTVTTLNDASGNNDSGALVGFSLTGTTSNWIASGGVTTGTSCSSFTPPTITASSNSSVNSGSTLNLTASSGFSSYSWTGPNSFTSTSQSPTITNITTAATGNYTVTGIISGGCSATSTTSVVVNTPAAALNFDKNDDIVNLGTQINLANQSFTIEAWAYRNVNNYYDVIFGGSTPTTDHGLFIGYNNINGFSFAFYADDLNTSTTFASDAGSWHHWACVYNANTTSGPNRFIYRDGVLVASDRANGNYVGTGALAIGQDIWGGGTFGGSIDEVRIWNRALCQSEIQNNMSCELNPSGQTGLLALYHFNEGFSAANNASVDTLFDASGNGKNGILGNFALSGTTSNWVAVGGVTTGTSCSAFTPPTITASSNSSVNSGSTLNLTASSGFSSYSWTGPNSFTSISQNPSISNITSSAVGTYTVIGTTSGGCSATSATTVVVNTPAASLNFDGTNDYIAISSNTNIPVGNSNYTLEAWIKPSVHAQNGIVGWGNYGTTSQTNVFRLGTSGSTYQLINYWWGNDLVVNSGNLADGNWHHVAATFDGTTRKIYIDGVLRGQDNPTGHNVPSASNLTIGKACSIFGTTGGGVCQGEFFNGSMDEVRIWSRALCLGEILNNMNCELNPSGQTGLSALYHFNQGYANANNSTVTTLADASANGNNGNLTGYTSLTGTTSNWIAQGAVTTGTSCSAFTPPTISASSNSTINTGSTLNLTSSSGFATYAWTGTNGFTSSSQNPSISNATTAASGTYSVTGTTSTGCSASATTSATVLLDTDGDGIPDINDLDADNDGILNVAECNRSNFYWSSTPSVSGYNATGTINGIAYTYTSSQPVTTTSYMYGNSVFPSSYNVPNSNPTIQNIYADNNTLTFASPMTNPVLVFASIGQAGLSVPITFSAPIQVVWSQNVVQNSSTEITGTEGYAIIRLMGTFSSISFNYLTAENWCNFSFGADFQSCGDNDNDGIPNYLDIDSDNDGCPDAIEGSAHFTVSQTLNNRLTGSVSSQGIPVLAGSGQGIGTSEIYNANCFCQVGIDQTAPTVLTRNISVNLNASGSATITASQIDSGSTDNCSIASYSLNKSTFNCSNIGVNTVTLTVTDSVGNSSSGSATVTIQDVTPPTITCASNVTAYSTAASCSTNVVVSSPTVTDNCTINPASIPAPFSTTSPALWIDATKFSTTNGGSLSGIISDASGHFSLNTTATYDASNFNGRPSVRYNNNQTATTTSFNTNQNTYIFTTVQIVAAGNNWASVFYHWNRDVGLTIEQNPLSPNSPSAGTAQYHFQTGNDNNYVEQNITYGTTYIMAAKIVGGNVRSFTLYKNNGGTLQNLGTSTNSSYTVPVQLGQLFLGRSDVGEYTNMRMGEFIYFQGGMPSGVSESSVINYLYTKWLGSTTATLTNNFNNTSNASGTYPKGTTTVTWTATDGSGNTSTCNQTVTVVDTIKPVVTTKVDTLTLQSNDSVSLSVSDLVVSSSDNCSVASITASQTTFTSSNIGNNTVTITATDSSGNSTSATTNVYIIEPAPHAICKPATVYLDTTGSANITANDVDNGSYSIVGLSNRSVSQSTFGCSNVGTTNNIWLVVTSNFGKKDSCQTTVTVYDNIAPTAIAQNVDVYLDSTGAASTTASAVNNGSYDNCSIASMTLSQTSFNCSNVGANTDTLTVNDVNGNVSTTTATVTVHDNIAPTVVTQNSTVYLDANGSASITAAQVNNGSSDNCGIASMSLSKTTFACSDVSSGQNYALNFDGVDDRVVATSSTGFSQGSNGRTVEMWIKTTFTGVAALHSYGNFSYHQRSALYLVSGRLYYVGEFNDAWGGTTTVNDGNWHHIAYTLSGQTLNFYIDGQLNFTTSTPSYPSTTGTAWALSNTSSISYTREPLLGIMDEVRVWSVARTSASIQSTYNKALVGNEPNLVAYYNFNEGSGSTLHDITSNHNNGTLTNMNTSVCWVAGASAISSVPVVTLTVTDNNNNTSTQTATVTVLDTIKPTAIAQNVDVYLDANGAASTTASAVNNGSYDNCSIASMTLSRTSFNCSNVGANTDTLTVNDINGNVSTTTATVTVHDNIAPTAIAQNVDVYLDANGAASTTASAVNNGSYDNCSIASMTLSQTSFNCSNVGANTDTLTVTDANGNVSTTTATVTVHDNIAPTVHTQNITIQLNASGAASITTSQINNGSTDNCSIASYSLDKTGFNCSNVGNNTVTLTVTDVNGNSSTGTATVTVQDNIAPTVITQNVTVTLSSGAASITASQVNNGSHDNCTIASMSVSPSSFTCSNIGNNTVTLTVTDVNGNVSTATAAVNVVGAIPTASISQGVQPGFTQGGAVVLTASSPTAVSYAWTSGPATAVYNVYASGTYTVTVTNSYGCTANASTSVSYTESNMLSAYTIIGKNGVHLENHITVYNGGVGVTRTSSEEREEEDDAQVQFEHNSNATASGTFVRAHRIETENNSTITNKIFTATPATLLPAFMNNPYCNNSGCTNSHHNSCSGSGCTNAHHNTCTGGLNKNIGQNATVTITDWVMGQVLVGNNATVTFTAAHIYMKGLQVHHGAHVIFSQCAVIKICNGLNIQDGVNFNTTNTSIVTMYVGDNVHVDEGSNVTANIYSREDISIEGSSSTPTTIRGMLIGEQIEAESYVNFYWNTNRVCSNNAYSKTAVAADEKGLIRNYFDVNVYPNPTYGSFNLQLLSSSPDAYTVEVYDMTGKLIESVKVTDSNLNQNIGADYSDGMYIIRVTQNDNVKTSRLIKVTK